MNKKYECQIVALESIKITPATSMQNAASVAWKIEKMYPTVRCTTIRLVEIEDYTLITFDAKNLIDKLIDKGFSVRSIWEEINKVVESILNELGN